MCRISVIFYFLILPVCAWTQIRPIGDWQSYQPYRKAIKLAAGTDELFCATRTGLFSINKNDNSIVRYSKVTGLSETAVSTITYDALSNKLLIAYTNSNIDILSNSRVSNIPDLKISPLPGDKNINDALFYKGEVYLSTGLGIIVVDAGKNTISETWYIGNGSTLESVNGLTISNGYFYALTATGLKKAPVDSRALANFSTWVTVQVAAIPPAELKKVLSFNQTTTVLANNQVYIEKDNSWTLFYDSGNPLLTISVIDNQLMLTEEENNAVKLVFLKEDGSVANTVSAPSEADSISDAIKWDGSLWITDAEKGLFRQSGSDWIHFTPDAPFDIPVGEIYALPGKIFFGGGSSSSTTGTGYISVLQRGEWKNYTPEVIPALDSMRDIRTVSFDQISGSLYAGSFGGGLIEIKEGSAVNVFKNDRLQQISGSVIDKDGNLWVVSSGTTNNLWVKKKNGEWLPFAVPFSTNQRLSQLLTDDYNQKWIVSPGNGLLCFHHGSTLENTGDDQWKLFRQGAGNGNLPSNDVLCIARDKNGFLWVGTSSGIGIIQCNSQVFSSPGCDAILPIVQQDNFFGYLLQNERITAIAIDGANRKWIGTDNRLWLLNPEGTKVIYRFTAENSPMPSDKIYQLGIEPESGELFIATEAGLSSFRSTATEGNTDKHQIHIFPNPVPPGYAGIIAIRGLMNNAHVKITEQDGRLVYQTRALGGQAIWNGKDYRGNQVASGVYIVLVSDESGKQTSSGKLVFVRGK